MGDRLVTIKDVARRAGVSTASVSRVISGGRSVTPEVAERVRRAAADLGYEVNSVGRSLRRRTTDTVGLVVADIDNPFFPMLIKALERALSAHGLGLLLVDAANDVDQERAAVRRLLARQVDALLITPVSRFASRQVIAEARDRCPVVQLDRRASSRAHYVGMDNDEAMVTVLTHLSSTGRNRCVFLGSDPQISTTWERQRAYQQIVGPQARVLLGDFSLTWGAVAAEEALRRWPATNALICADDLIAMGALEYLSGAQIPVPDQVCVLGFDDTILARLHTPAVTSVAQPLAQMAEAAISLAAAPPSASHRARRFPATLMIRASSPAALTG
jgi:LacI family transcriptional regulator